MLADPRAEALVEQLRRPVAAAAQPAEPAPELGRVSRTSTTTCGRRSSARPSCSSTASCARTAASLDLLTADYTFVNERLAQHYGIPNVYGSQFRRVTLTDDARRGLLGQGSILMVTSHADRTSPVVRGKWILENLLGTPPPPPPPNVPPLKENADARQAADDARADGGAPREPGLRQLPQADGSARLRARELRRGRRVADARRRRRRSTRRASWPTARKVDGVVTLRQALLQRPEMFVGTMTEKLLTYALGRGLDYYDMPAVRAIVRDAAAQRLPLLVARAGHRQQRAVSDADARQPSASAQTADGSPSG